jgi:UDP-N-acetylmuramoyl-tripeptide--D-alanyl-D-alanine ligase
MLELGPYEKQGHELVGIRAAGVADQLVTVGPRGAMIAAAARNTGMQAKNIREFEDAEAAIAHLRKVLSARDVVLIKGSRGVHMERITAALEVSR